MIGSATIKVRPTRFAMLVDPIDANQIRDAIRLACSLWGGTFCPIVPLYTKAPSSWKSYFLPPPTAKEMVQGYIDAFDPDVLVQFAKELPDYLVTKDRRIVTPKDVWTFRFSWHRPDYGIGAFHILEGVFAEYFKYRAKYPPKIIVPNIPKRLRLFWTSVFGEYPEPIRDGVLKHFREPLEITQPDASIDAYVDLGSTFTLAPRLLTQWQLNLRGGGFGAHAAVYFLDAAKVEDIVDYWNLRASGRQVLPLPVQFVEHPDFRNVVKEFLISERRAPYRQPNLVEPIPFIRSRNCSMSDMRAYAASIDFSDQKFEGSNVPPYSLQDWFPRFWSEWHRQREAGVADVYGRNERSVDLGDKENLQVKLEAMIPDFVDDEFLYTDAMCGNEVDIQVYGAKESLAEVFPKVEGPHLESVVNGTTGVANDWRVGRHGLVRMVKNRLSSYQDIHSGKDVLFAWLSDKGWETKLSPPGLLAEQIYKQLDGYPNLIADKAVMSLIEHMNGGAIGADGKPYKEDYFSGIRSLPVAEVKQRLGNGNRSPHLYEAMIKKGVFHLGVQTRCPRCQRESWFSLSSLNETLACSKCLGAFTAIGNIDQSKSNWYYRTAGPFSVPKYAEGAYTVLFTIELLHGRGVRSVRATAIPSFTATSPDGKVMEIDFAVLWRQVDFAASHEAGIIFGECKTYGEFEKRDIQRMKELGAKFPGSVLVFSTLRTSITGAEKNMLKQLARWGRKYWKGNLSTNPVMLLTGNELFHHQAPPYCWPKETRDRFQHQFGVHGLCESTQQLYLDLPPVHADWKASEDRKRAARARRADRTRDIIGS